MTLRALFFAMLAGLSTLAQADTRAHEKEELARFERFAGAPVDEFAMIELFRSQVVGPENVVIWPTLRDAYLVRVQQPCRQLEWAHALSVSQAQKWKVSRKFDSIDVGTPCRIVEILPIDLAGMREAANEKKDAT